MTEPRGRLSPDAYTRADTHLAESDARIAASYPGELPGRQPVHTAYLPAGRFHSGLIAEWGEQALAVLDEHGAALGLDPEIGQRVRRKLGTEPVEDLRIDFEDGYGHPGDAAEDAAALAAGRELATAHERGSAPPFCGIRFKSLEAPTRRRGIRTLDLFLAGLLEGAERPALPGGFVLTLPKVTAVEQVAVAADLLAELESVYRLPSGSLRFEVQIETSQSIVDTQGALVAPLIIRAAAGRCAGLHYGTYDYSAGLGIGARYQSMDHPAADLAKQLTQVAAAGTGVRLSDGSTNRLPLGGPEQVLDGWREHLRLIRRSLGNGFYQGWDLHPHQLPSRFAATYAFFREGLTEATDRLRDYAAEQTGAVLDEPATVRALADYLCRGLDCGALDQAEVTELSTVAPAELARYARRG